MLLFVPVLFCLLRSYCSESAKHLIISDVLLDPSPPVKGKRLTINVDGKIGNEKQQTYL